MADSFLALADLVKINDARLADREITDLLDEAPLLAKLAADTSPDTTHRYVKETGAPVVGFRAVNAGRDNSKSADTLVTIDLKVLDASHAIDVALAQGYGKGIDPFLAREALRHLRAAFSVYEKQVLNGTVDGDAGGFVGLADALLLANAMVVNAGGTTADTGSSVYAIRTTPDKNNVTVIAGQSGNIDIGETVIQRILDGDGKSYPAYYTPISAWLGLQIGSAHSVGRLANLTADSGKTLDDDKIADLLSKFPSNRGPNYLVMNRRSLAQLRQSRTATNATGAPAPFPTEAYGVPIIVTDSILSTEALLA